MLSGGLGCLCVIGFSFSGLVIFSRTLRRSSPLPLSASNKMRVCILRYYILLPKRNCRPDTDCLRVVSEIFSLMDVGCLFC